ncbi:hypothetical protein OROMI_004100 [Orobanche minor]
MVMEKNYHDAAKKARQEAEQVREATERLRAEVIEARKSLDAAIKETTEGIVAASQRADAAEGKAGQAMEELVVRVAELEKVKAELAGMKAEAEEIKGNPYKNLEYAAEFAYYLAYADALHASKKGGLEVGPLVEAFKTYTVERPLNLFFTIPILDLSTEYGIDLSWYAQPDRLVQLDSPEDEAEEETIEDGGIGCPKLKEEIGCSRQMRGRMPVELGWT